MYGPVVAGVGVVARATGVVFVVAAVAVVVVAVVVKGWCRRKGAFCQTFVMMSEGNEQMPITHIAAI